MDNDISVREVISNFNRSELRKRIMPMGMASGWPSIRKMGKTLCITIPYFSRSIREDKKVALNSIYCSVTLAINNPDKLMDYTIYRYQRDWADVDYDNPVGLFPHDALEGIKRSEYHHLCDQLYDLYDQMVAAVQNGERFEKEKEMAQLFGKLMEPAHYPQYLRINKKFYSAFCNQ